MSLWRYNAVPLGVGVLRTDGGGELRTGELAGDTAEEVRAQLRGAGLRALELKPVGRPPLLTDFPFVERWDRHLQVRRQPAKSEFYDGLATMLRSGIPLLDAVTTLAETVRGGLRDRARRTMLLQLGEHVRSGGSLAGAMRDQPTWFDAVEIAMVDAGQVGGTLSDVMSTLANRHARSGELTHRLIGALAYPSIVTMVGIGVVVFLSVKVLPDLVLILADAEIEVPLLTRGVMAAGAALVRFWPIMLATVACAVVGSLPISQIMRRRGIAMPARLRRFAPNVFRRIETARLAFGLAALVRTGIPLVEAARVIAPTLGSASSLRTQLESAALRVERGEELSAALDDPLWFDAEFRRLLAVGQATGELPTLLERIGERYQRRAERVMDRLTSLLEPAVILVLATLVGLVVMGAILPLVRLQEVL